MAGFIFGGDTGVEGPAELQRRRAVIDALGEKARAAAPRNVGEGLSAIGQALSYRIGEKRLAKKEATARQGAVDQFGQVTSALLGGQSYAPRPAIAGAPMGTATPASVQSAPLTANPAGLPQGIIDAVDRVDPPGGGVTAETIKAGLVQRGLPQHVAEAFVMNFQDESGLNPAINEIAPIVPGSRGGFGLAQWTGPRRVALEQFAAERGASVADPNVQMDFLMTELQGPEARAASNIFAAPDAGTAAQAIVRDFLRPAPENLDRRMAEYGGGGFSTPPAMSGGVDPAIINQLAELSANPYLPEGQRAVVDALLQKQLAQIGQTPEAVDPMAAIELEKAQLELEQMRTGRGGTTELSLTPQYGTDENGNLVMLQVGKDGRAVQTVLPEGVALTRGIEKIDLGDSFVFMNTLTGERIGEPVPKNLGAAEREKAIGTATGKSEGDAAAQIEGARLKAQAAFDIIDAISNDPALPAITGTIQGGLLAPGIPGITGGQAGTDLAAKIENLEGIVFVQAYDSIRGAGQITEQEGAAAKAAVANLKRAQSPEAYKAALADLKQKLADLLAIAEAKAARAGGAGAGGDTGSGYTFNPETGELE
jgi:hypothetical protein